MSKPAMPKALSSKPAMSRTLAFVPHPTLLRLPVMLLALALPFAVHAAEVTVDQVKEKFNQDGLTLKAGDTVVFTNSDPVKHNLTVVTPDEESKDLGMEAPGTSVRYTPAKPGVYDVRCSIHPKMKMKVKVD